MDKQKGRYFFREVHGFCPESYEVYVGDKKVACITERNSRITVRVGKEVVFEAFINEHKEDVSNYLDKIVEVLDKNVRV